MTRKKKKANSKSTRARRDTPVSTAPRTFRRKGGATEILVAKVDAAGQKHRRELNAENVAALKESMTLGPLANPITVDPKGGLIAGAHRLQAARELGWEYIPCTVLEVDELQAEMAELDENIIRAQLTAVELAKRDKRRKEIHLLLHPETKHGGSGRGRDRQSGEIRHSNYAEDSAAKTGRSARSVRESVALGEGIPDDLATEIKTTMPLLANHRGGLNKVARAHPAEKRGVAIREEQRLTDKAKKANKKAKAAKKKAARKKTARAGGPANMSEAEAALKQAAHAVLDNAPESAVAIGLLLKILRSSLEEALLKSVPAGDCRPARVGELLDLVEGVLRDAGGDAQSVADPVDNEPVNGESDTDNPAENSEADQGCDGNASSPELPN